MPQSNITVPSTTPTTTTTWYTNNNSNVIANLIDDNNSSTVNNLNDDILNFNNFTGVNFNNNCDLNVDESIISESNQSTAINQSDKFDDDQCPTNKANSIEIIKSLRQALNEEKMKRIRVEKELELLKKKYLQLLEQISKTKTLRDDNDLSSKNKIIKTKRMSIKNRSRKLDSADLKCTFPDCNFVTVYKEKLDFHLKAHLMSKYKCPYCPYVSDTIADIKKHIRRGDRHEGLKMYSCNSCSFSSDYDRQFREHLRKTHFTHDERREQAIEYFIEEMFLNKNKQRNDLIDQRTAVASGKGLLSTADDINKPSSSSIQPSNKKLAVDDNRQLEMIKIVDDSLSVADENQTFFDIELAAPLSINQSPNISLLLDSSSDNVDKPLTNNTIPSISTIEVVQENLVDPYVGQPNKIISPISSDPNLNQLFNSDETVNTVAKSADFPSKYNDHDSSLTTTITPIPISEQYLDFETY